MFENDSIHAFQRDTPKRTKEKNMASPAKQNTDDFIMDTNNSSIVSKRSVEKLYYPDEPEYFRYFVHKLKRRSPLINRGYWLRMKAIDHAVASFLDELTEKKKVVINLGCGYDPLPFQWLSRRPDAYEKAVFVDVDYPQLMRKKAEVISVNDALCGALSGFHRPQVDSAVIARSKEYLAVGCDLRELDELAMVLEEELHVSECSMAVLFVAEVSVAYMTREASQAVLEWAAGYEDVRFCLLEQQIPDGKDHPFAQTMLKHFEKLRTPLRAVGTMDQMKERFAGAGWPTDAIDIRSLWKFWQDLPDAQRRSIDAVEPFDEWEEFALFGLHYFILVARKQLVLDKDSNGLSTFSSDPCETLQHADQNGSMAGLDISELPEPHSYRRFAAVLPAPAVEQSTTHVGIHGGLGTRERLSTCDMYGSVQTQCELRGPPLPSALMCHTITRVNPGPNYLLVGGRTSPNSASVGCWLRHDNTWRPVQSLPEGRYRHCAVPVSFVDVPGGVLVAGGKRDDGSLRPDWMLWSPERNWQCLEVSSEEQPSSRFGASLCLDIDSTSSGYLTGGMDASGLVIDDIWRWTLHIKNKKVMVSFEDITKQFESSLGVLRPSLGRFGASIIEHDNSLLLVGGIGRHALLTRRTEVLDLTKRIAVSLRGSPRPLLVGCSITSAGEDLLALGGGATCFSFGTHWNSSCLLRLFPHGDLEASWCLLPSPANVRSNENSFDGANGPPTVEMPESTAEHKTSQRVQTIPRLKVNSSAEFDGILAQGNPVVLQGSDIGPCVSQWTNEYLKHKIGAEREVIVHSSPTSRMDFQTKNFDYVPIAFGGFLDDVERGEMMYLRALSSSKPADRPTVLAEDYPGIAGDFRLPPELSYVLENVHSSPLRISGPVTMWLHYDVMANVLCQIKGKKRLMLLPPSDVAHLGLRPGASSSSIDVFQPSHPALAHTHPHEALLEPGDILFLPPLWLHSAAPTDGTSIAVNVFFRNLEKGYAAGKDVYGNRDLAAYEKGRKDVERIVKSFEGMPQDARQFYLERLGLELIEKAKAARN